MLQPAQLTTHCGVTGEPLRIPREDWGTSGNIGENLGQSLPLLRILLTQLTCMSTLSFLNPLKGLQLRTE